MLYEILFQVNFDVILQRTYTEREEILLQLLTQNLQKCYKKIYIYNTE